MFVFAALGGGPLVVAGAPLPTTVKAVQIYFDALPGPGSDFMAKGTNFNNGSTPVVTLGSSPTPLAIIAQPTATPIQVACPVDALTTVPTCPVGDSLLKVTTGTGTKQKATYDLTIGAVEPVGALAGQAEIG